MLVASLPALPIRFDAGRLPITRATLRTRMNMLDPEDHRVIDQVAAFFVWDRQPLDRTDEEVLQTYNQLMREIDNPLVRRIIDHRIDMRTIVTAIRRHQHGDGPPEGIGQTTPIIRRNWNQPGFGLQNRFWWIDPFTRALEAGRVREGQHTLFTDLWKTWTKISEQYFFTFEAIILYLARWEIVDRWTSQNADEGRRRFDDLITETMGEYANLY
jgi:hypothetical protein